MEKIRQTYKVPGKMGMPVIVDGHSGTIIGASKGSMHFRVRFDATNRVGYVHPTWEIQYFDADHRQVWPEVVE